MRRLLAGLVLALALAGPALAKPPVWVVRDGDSEMLIFGSVHLLPPGLDWRPTALDAAISRADDLWFELPVDQETRDASARLARAHGFLPGKASLFALLPPEIAARLVRVADTFRADKLLLDRLQPWFAEIVVEAATYRIHGGVTDEGVEQILAAAAPPTAQRRAFETAVQQIAMIAEAPRADQIASLDATLRDLETRPEAYKEVIAHWMAGDLAALQKESIDELRAASPKLFKRVIARRNARWTDTLHQRLKGRGRTVVVVGMGHLIGPGGVPARLRALGYSVEGP